MRENFFKGTSRSFASRIRNLDGIIRFFEENEVSSLSPAWRCRRHQLAWHFSHRRQPSWRRCTRTWEDQSSRQWCTMCWCRWLISSTCGPT